MRAGVGTADLVFADGHGLFGYGPRGGTGLNVPLGSAEHDTLQARALYIEDGAQKLLVVGFDLPSGSRLVHKILLDALARAGIMLAPGQLMVVGTHTHSAPGHSFGNLYDAFGTWPALYRSEVVTEIARRGLAAARKAMSAPVPCLLGVARRVLWGAGRNRSLTAFARNFEGDITRWRDALGVEPPSELPPEEVAVDPRLTALAFVAKEDRRPLATWATWCCHPASYHPAKQRPYHRDWCGVAVDRVERDAGVPFAMIHQGANGDVTAIPTGERRIADSIGRVRELGAVVANVWREAMAEAAQTATDAPLEVGFRSFVPERAGLPRFEIGQSVIAGSEEALPGYLVKALGEARRFTWRAAPQRPKLPALGPLQSVLRASPALRVSPEHPLWLVRLGSHLLFASPFEQTTMAAWTTEQAILAAWKEQRGEDISASALGLAGDYAGYVTTALEYEAQCYEGGHTIYGKGQREALERAWSSLVTSAPMDAAAVEAFGSRDATFESRTREVVSVL